MMVSQKAIPLSMSCGHRGPGLPKCAYLEINCTQSNMAPSAELAQSFSTSVCKYSQCSLLRCYTIKWKGPILTVFFSGHPRHWQDWHCSLEPQGLVVIAWRCRGFCMHWVRIITWTVCVDSISLAELLKNYFPVPRIKCRMHLFVWRC